MNDDNTLGELPEAALRMEEALDDLADRTDGDVVLTLSEVNGFLAGILTCPEAIGEDEWMDELMGKGEEGDTLPFATPAEEEAFRTVARAYYESVQTEFAEDNFEPIYEADGEDEEEVDIIWELWVLGFTRAYILRPDAWQTYLESADTETSDAMMMMIGLMAVADPEGAEDAGLEEEDLAELEEGAPDAIAFAITTLFASRQQLQ